MKATQLIHSIQLGNYDKRFSQLYSPSALERQRNRYIGVLKEFISLYGDREVTLFSVPGRTELSGNHTDHNNGMVLAASVDIDIIAAAAKTGEPTVRMKSEGYREDVVDVAAPSKDKVPVGKSASLIAGVADYLLKHGYKAGGYCACTTSDVMSGSGLSSSAAFEVMCGRIFSEFYNNGEISPMELAKAGKYAENEFFGKPCGLMDQAACANGGCLWIDFGSTDEPKTERLELNLASHGYCLCIVNTGGNHADLTDDYAAVPTEMKKIASLFGKPTLRSCDETEFTEKLPSLRRLAGDRAVLRAMHFFAENRRVEKQRDSLKNGDFKEYLSLVQSSGDSSYKFLQNVYTTKNVAEQGISLALAISESFGAVCRVHGGGFAGTIQAYIPQECAEEYKARIESVFGNGSCRVTSIRAFGASVVTENEIR